MKQTPRIGIGMGDMGDIGIGISVWYRFFKVISVKNQKESVSYRYIGNIPIFHYHYRYGSISNNRYRFEKSPYRYQYIDMLPIYRYDTDTDIHHIPHTDTYSWSLLHTDTDTDSYWFFSYRYWYRVSGLEYRLIPGIGQTLNICIYA